MFNCSKFEFRLIVILFAFIFSYPVALADITPDDLPAGAYVLKNSSDDAIGTLNVVWIQAQISLSASVSDVCSIINTSPINSGYWSDSLNWDLLAQPTLFGNYMLKVITQGGEQIQTALFNLDSSDFDEFLSERGPTQQSVTVPVEIKIGGYAPISLNIQIATTKYHVDVNGTKNIYLDQNSHLESIDIASTSYLGIEPSRELTVDNSSHNSGTIHLGNSATVNGNGRLFNQSGGRILGPGTGSANFSSIFDNEGVIETQEGELILSASSGVSFNSGTIRASEGQLQINTQINNLVPNGIIEAADPNSVVQINNSANITGGLLTGTGTFLGNGGMMSGSSVLQALLSVTDNDLTNEGDVTISGAGSSLATSDSTELYSWTTGNIYSCPPRDSSILGLGSLRLEAGAELHLNSLQHYNHTSSSGGGLVLWGYDRYGKIDNNIFIDSASKLISSDVGGARNANLIYGDIENAGTMEIDYDLRIYGKLDNQSVCDIAAELALESEIYNENTLTLSGGTLVFGGESITTHENIIEGSGTVKGALSGETVKFAGQNTIYADTLINNNTLEIPGKCQVTDHDLTNEGAISIVGSGALLETSNSTELYSWTVGNSSSCPIVESVISGEGTILVKNGATLQLNSLQKYSGYYGSAHHGYDRHGQVDNDISIEHNSSLISFNAGDAKKPNIINGDLNSNGLIEINQDLRIYGKFLNQGSCNIYDDLYLESEIENQSKMTLSGGSVVLGTQSSNSGANVIEGSGTVKGVMSGDNLYLKSLDIIYTDSFTVNDVVDIDGVCQVADNDVANNGLINVSGYGSVLETSKSTVSYAWTRGNPSSCPPIESEITGTGKIYLENGGQIQLNSLQEYQGYWGSAHHGYDRYARVYNDIVISPTSKLVSQNAGGAKRANYIYGNIENSGIIEINHDTVFDGIIYNDANLIINDNFNFQDILLDSGYIFAASLNVNTGDNVSGTGIIEADVSNAGVISPGLSSGLLEVRGDYTQTGSLRVDIGGLIGGEEYDVLDIQGDAVLGGTLYVTLSDRFLPVPGDVFEIIHVNSVSGQFADVVGLDICGRPAFDIVYGADSVQLVATSTEVPGDFDGDDIVDIFDIDGEMAFWLAQDCDELNNWCDWADLNYDGKVDLADFTKFSSYWMAN